MKILDIWDYWNTPYTEIKNIFGFSINHPPIIIEAEFNLIKEIRRIDRDNSPKGVYLFFNSYTDEILYIGRAKDLRKRLYMYMGTDWKSASANKYQEMLKDAKDYLEIMVLPTLQNLELERHLLSIFKPRYNFARE